MSEIHLRVFHSVHYSQGESVLFAVRDKRVLSRALVTEKLNLFSLAGLHLSCIFLFLFRDYLVF